jgi:hypothetical protein
MSPNPEFASSASSTGGERSDPDDLLARAECFLERLSREAEAARAEARRAELQIALADARRGNREQLHAWMTRHDASYSARVETTAGHIETLHAAHGLLPSLGESTLAGSVTAVANATIEKDPIDSPETFTQATGLSESPLESQTESRQTNWSRFLPAARQRLAARATYLSDGKSVQEVLALSSSALADARSEVQRKSPQLRVDAPHSTVSELRGNKAAVYKPTAKTTVDSESLKSESPQTKSPKTLTSKTLASKTLTSKTLASKTLTSKTQSPAARSPETALEKRSRADAGGSRPGKLDGQTIAKLAKSIEDVEANQQQSSLRQRLFRGMSGISLSIILHVLLVIALAALTIKLPAPPASLMFETSVNSTAETFELSEQMEVSEPEALSETAQLPEMAVDLAQDLNQISNSMSDTLAQSVPSPAGLASAALAASNASSSKSNMQANASFFGAAASGNCFCYVIDSSSSMKGGPWEAAKSELLRSLSTLKSNQRFYIIFFNQELSAIPKPGEREPAARAMYAEPENVEHAKRWIDTIRIAKGAPPSDALEFAVSLEPDAIYLLTDGDTKTDLAGFLREKNRIFDLIEGEQVKVPIHAIAFYSLVGQQLMRTVAAENKGQFIYVPDPSKK